MTIKKLETNQTADNTAATETSEPEVIRTVDNLSEKKTRTIMEPGDHGLPHERRANNPLPHPSYKENTVESLLTEACTRAGINLAGLLDWSIKENQVILIDQNGAKYRINW